MFFVEARYHDSPKRVADRVRYIAHREEVCPTAGAASSAGSAPDTAPFVETRGRSAGPSSKTHGDLMITQTYGRTPNLKKEAGAVEWWSNGLAGILSNKDEREAAR